MTDPPPPPAAERPLYYRLLDDHTAVPCPRDQRGYAQVGTALLPDGTRVSTAFWGQDMALDGPPVLFETMVFGGLCDGYQWRFGTWAEAAAFHVRVVRALLAGPSGPRTEALPVPDLINGE
jgi:hypothetical protein